MIKMQPSCVSLMQLFHHLHHNVNTLTKSIPVGARCRCVGSHLGRRRRFTTHSDDNVSPRTASDMKKATFIETSDGA